MNKRPIEEISQEEGDDVEVIQLNKDNIDLSKLENKLVTEEDDPIEPPNKVQKVTEEDGEEADEIPNVESKPDPSLRTKRNNHIRTINGYKIKFGHKLQDLDLSVNLRSLSLTELEELLDDIRFTIGSQNNSVFWNNIIYAGATVVEGLSKKDWIPLDLEGFASDLNDPIFQELVDEVTLENASWTYVSPTVRLTNCLIQIMYARHTLNQHSKSIKPVEIPEKPVPQEIVDKFKHL